MEWERYNLLSKEEKEEYNYKFPGGLPYIIFWTISKFFFALSTILLLLLVLLLVNDPTTVPVILVTGTMNIITISFACVGLSIIELLATMCLRDVKRRDWLKTKFEVVKITKVKELKKKK